MTDDGEGEHEPGEQQPDEQKSDAFRGSLNEPRIRLQPDGIENAPPSSAVSTSASSAEGNQSDAAPRWRFRLSQLLKRPRSLRAQLAFWHGGLLGLTLLLLAAFTYLLLREFLNDRADSALQEYAEVTSKEVAIALYQYQTLHPGKLPGADMEAHFVDNSDLQSWGRYVQIIDTRGRAVAVSDALRTNKLPVPSDTLLGVLTSRNPRFDTITSLGQYPVRMVTLPVQMGDRVPYLVQVGASVEGVEAALQRASFILLILTPSVFLVALFGGWFLVGRALKPVDEMTRAALTIESKRLDLRLVPPRTDNEIGRLAGALNEMIARLDRSFRQIERFSADASHELKTPLTTIRGEAEVALMSELNPNDTRRTFQSIIEETERLTSIVNNLLLLSRADADQVRLKHERLAFEEVVLQAYEPLERLARRKNIVLDLEEMESVQLAGDSLWLGQLVTNLIHNAVHYTPEGGRVYVSLRVETDQSGATTAVFRVRDTGPGIPSEHIPYLFDRFYRVDSGRSREHGGSGLGLNIAHWIVESHNGHISVESVPGNGATFTVRLPVTL